VSRALVVGNGESRLLFDLKNIKDQFSLIGCNAVYRDVDVSHLICCDQRMVLEATKKINPEKTKIYTRRKWLIGFDDYEIESIPELPYIGELRQDQPQNWNSGPYAVLLACTMNFQEIFLMGFDLYSINGKVNNVYKGTENYQGPETRSIDPQYWIYQISKLFEIYKDKRFIIVNEKDWPLPESWNLPNVSFRNIGDFFIDNKYSRSIITT